MTRTIGPVSFNPIRQVVFEYQAFKVLKSIKSMKFISQNNITTLKHAINSANRVYVFINIYYHFPYEIIMYYNYFSKGHNVGTTFVHPFPALW